MFHLAVRYDDPTLVTSFYANWNVAGLSTERRNRFGGGTAVCCRPLCKLKTPIDNTISNDQ